MNPIQTGLVVAGKYRLEVCRARGGMGSVWQARHLLLDTPLAIKFIDPLFSDSPEARGRFEREAKTVALLRGTHVAQIHDYGVEGEIPYIVMELLHGEDLSARLNREKRLPLSTAVLIVSQVAKVLRRAHAAGVIHRDLKPANIYLVPGDDDDETVKVLDFGVAKTSLLLDPNADPTKSGTLVGSPRYMSPEQARGVKSVDHRTDLWSLGVIAYRMITGELPFPGSEIGDVILKICTQLAPAPSSFVPDLPWEVDRFFERALQREPERRFQTAEEMARGFAQATGQLAPVSPPDPVSLGRALARFRGPAEAQGAQEGAQGQRPSPPPLDAEAEPPSRPSIPEDTLPSSVAKDPDATPVHAELRLERSTPVQRPRERRMALGARLRWSATGALAASALLGAVLLLLRTPPPPPPSPASPPLAASFDGLLFASPAKAERAPDANLPSRPSASDLPAPAPPPSARRSPAPPRPPHRSAKTILGI